MENQTARLDAQAVKSEVLKVQVRVEKKGSDSYRYYRTLSDFTDVLRYDDGLDRMERAATGRRIGVLDVLRCGPGCSWERKSHPEGVALQSWAW